MKSKVIEKHKETLRDRYYEISGMTSGIYYTEATKTLARAWVEMSGILGAVLSELAKQKE